MKDHALRHGEGLQTAEYLADAIKNTKEGKRFLVRHNGQNKFAYIRRLGEDEFQFTSTSLNGKKILTHFKVNGSYLRSKGITIPKGL